jgi:iron complex outermembrane recepter protein
MSVFKKSSIAIAITAALNSSYALAEDNESFTLEEIVVTAQKRQENLQDVPVSVNVVTGDQILKENIGGFEDMAATVPNLEYVDVANISVISIRGIGTSDNDGAEQSVGLFFDGVHQARSRQYRATSFLDVGSVEVLRGPQGTLFGKNTTAGAMNVTSARPTEDLEARVTTTYNDELDQYTVEGMISGGLTDNLRGRLAFRQQESEGFFDNEYLDENVTNETLSGGRALLEWDASDEVMVTFKYELGRSNTRGLPARTLNTDVGQYQLDQGLFAIDAAIGGAWAVSPSISGVRTVADLAQAYAPNYRDDDYLQFRNKEKDNTDTELVSVSVDWEIGEYTLTSITGYANYEYKQNRDGDYTPARLLEQYDKEDFDAWSQEIRLTSPLGVTFLGQEFDYIVGLYYQDQNLSHDEDLDLGFSTVGTEVGVEVAPNTWVALAAPDASNLGNYESNAETWALFSNIKWNISDDLSATFGARWSRERKNAARTLAITDYKTSTVSTDPLVGGILASFGRFNHAVNDSRVATNFSPSLKVQYDMNEDMMVYASASKAFKSGGFNSKGTYGNNPGVDAPVGSLQNFEFDDEEVVSYEIGAKGMFLDDRLEMNLALFYMELTDEQVSVFNGTSFDVGNEGESTYEGIEIDSKYLITENLLLDLSVAYLQGEVKDSGSSTREVGDKGLPEWSVSAALNHDWNISDSLILTSRVSFAYTDDRISNSTERVFDSHTLMGARLGLGSADGVWEVALIGDNLLDEEILLGGSEIPLMDGAYQSYQRPPRNVAVQFTYNWQ